MVQNGGVKMTVSLSKSNWHPAIREGVSQCQKSLDSDSDTPPTGATDLGVSLTKPGLVRILLGKAASEALDATGADAFTIVARSKRGTTEPETAGRWEISLMPIEWPTARDACLVLMGEKHVAKPKRSKPISSPQKP